jgi:hypothetical protein
VIVRIGSPISARDADLPGILEPARIAGARYAIDIIGIDLGRGVGAIGESCDGALVILKKVVPIRSADRRAFIPY